MFIFYPIIVGFEELYKLAGLFLMVKIKEFDHHLRSIIYIYFNVSQDAEQKVYLKDGTGVLKLNTPLYCTSWGDHFYYSFPNFDIVFLIR